MDFRSSRPILLDMSRNKYHGLGVSEEKMTRSKKEKGISSNTMSRRLNPSVAKTGYGLHGIEFAGVKCRLPRLPRGHPIRIVPPTHRLALHDAIPLAWYDTSVWEEVVGPPVVQFFSPPLETCIDQTIPSGADFIKVSPRFS